ncbi:MAG: chitosanase [Deltaproteobacteria bacterium]|nr:chitosanase [Deltaproteobacteria bacterium]
MGGWLGTSASNERKHYVTTSAASRTVEQLIEITAEIESRGAGDYSAINLKDNNAGVSFGVIQFNQKWGALGELFRRMYEEDPEAFIAATYGNTKVNKDPKALAERLIEELNDPSPSRRLTGSLARHLGEPIWLRRYAALGENVKFREVQDKLALSHFVGPGKKLAAEFGLKSERAHAVMIDLCVQHGEAGARFIIAEALRKNPKDTAAWKNASDADRPAAEHVMLYNIGERSAILMAEKKTLDAANFDGLIKRRNALLHDTRLSDKEAPLEAPIELPPADATALIHETPPASLDGAFERPSPLLRRGICMRQPI